MKFKLNYGYDGLEIEVKDSNVFDIAESRNADVVKSPVKALKESFRNPIGTNPLSEKISTAGRICIVISDSTRAVPTKIILEALLSEMENCSIKKEQITILIATGLHRPNLGSELENLVGREIMDNYKIVNHYARDRQACKMIGNTRRGTPVIINKTYLEADFRILTGLIEPHFMAGFSGGRKAICPGISYMDMFKHFHGPEILESPFASNAVLENNPFHMESLEIAKMAGVDFIVNVTINKNKEITGIFSGDLEAAFYEGAAFCKEYNSYKIKGEADIVITSGGGLPLDATLYQAVKGMVAAMPAVKKDGMIIIASECNEEIGSKEFVELVTNEKDLDAFIEKIKDPDFFVIDQWELEELAKARKKAEIYLYSPCLSACANKIPDGTLKLVPSVEEALEIGFEKFGRDAKVTIIPEGPYTIPIK
ncbi:MAG TPA: nickel-dependent lactate racemase [Actinobacteria bacterium]|jgi:nickel-dependent lactate racemase|nr:nickel-dependent lactate racemase [Actinomycetota bacterium]